MTKEIIKAVTASFAIGFVSAATAKIISEAMKVTGMIEAGKEMTARETLELLLELCVLEFPLWLKSTIISKGLNRLIAQSNAPQFLGTVVEKITKFGLINELKMANLAQSAAFGLGGKLVWHLAPGPDAPETKPVVNLN